MGGYQQLLRGEPFRAKFRNSWEKPEPLTPGKETEIDFTMPDLFHTFRRGHRIMVQVQSSWFPLTDRNPQTFTDIPNAAGGVPEGHRAGLPPEGRGQRRGSAGDAAELASSF
jgi:predicted acyl esterase